MKALYGNMLFKDMNHIQVDALMKRVPHFIKQYGQDQTVLQMGDLTSNLGIVLSGQLLIQDEDFWGNRSILTSLKESDIFAETYACLGQPLHVSVIASEDSEILFVNPQDLLNLEPMIANSLLQLLAYKNVTLTAKIRHVSQRSTKEKLLAYLSDQSKVKQSSCFTIPFNRQELADYLAVDRSALSQVISQLSRNGYLTYHKNVFTLLRRNQSQ